VHLRLPSPAIVIACVALLLAAGGTSVAAINATGTAMNIVDPVTAANKAKVDANGKLLVSAGGTVSARPLNATTPWNNVAQVATAQTVLLNGPQANPINVSSLSVSLVQSASATDTADVFLVADHVPSSATTCAGAVFDSTPWHVARLTGNAPLTVSFPTPIQIKPAAGTKVCLFAGSFSTVDVTFSANGFIG